MKIIAVVSALVAALLAGCTIVPLTGHGYSRPGYHYGHIPPGHYEHGHKRWWRRHY